MSHDEVFGIDRDAPRADEILLPTGQALSDWVHERMGLRPDRFLLSEEPVVTVRVNAPVTLHLNIALTQDDVDSLRAVWAAPEAT